MNAHKVLHAEANTDAYRSAVATIINDIERAADHTLVQISESIDCSLGTISNAKNMKSDLNATYLARLGQVYGAAYLNPYFAMFGAQAAPIEKKTKVDVLPLVSKVALKIAEARDPAGPGGAAEVPQERRGYLSDLKAMQRETGCLIAEIEGAY